MEFDDRRTASLDGVWDFHPGDHQLSDLDRLEPQPIVVPGLWEAQGHLDLDGVAWYRHRFLLDDVTGGWTLRFGAVMDLAQVFLNGRWLGAHEQAFTPFELDAGPALVEGENDLAVRVVDPSLRDPDHVRMAHGKQGWANHVFPSRPSLYMTYGGIWQPVTLRRHGAVVIGDVSVRADPGALTVTVELENRGEATVARLGVRTLGRADEREVPMEAGGGAVVEVPFGATRAARWRPADPVLHDVLVDVWLPAGLSDSRAVRYGLRSVGLDARGLLLDGEPVRMKSVLVQGFRADRLYAEGTREQIRQEVAAARAMGFNMLRLHIKAFDPVYLDVCDEMGMLLHCDIPVAEPLAHDELGDDTLLARRCLLAAREQVRRDRNHPSIVLWSAMNEVGDDRDESPLWVRYATFARALYGAVRAEDPSRPVIENDWIHPDPERVLESPIVTAHWYGRLHRDYLDEIDRDSAAWTGAGRPLFVTEFGDWGLPDMPVLAQPPFWDTRAVHAAGLADTLWPASLGRFARETQRYQGLADRLQAEVFRRHDHLGGYCLTELTDVPYELNGLLDLHRRPKPLAVAEVARANQVVLPMLALDTLVAAAGEAVAAPLHLANDGDRLEDVWVEAGFGHWVGEAPGGEAGGQVRVGGVPGHRAMPAGQVSVTAPACSGSHDLVLRLRAGDAVVAENRYPVQVVGLRPAAVTVCLLGSDGTAEAVGAAGAVLGEGPVVVGEGDLDARTGAEARRHLEEGRVVLVLAQEPASAEYYPVPVALEPLATAWGSTLFRFTTDHGALPALPRRALLVAEDSTIHAGSALTRVGDQAFPDTPVVIAYKPVPGATTGTVVGSHGVAAGRLVLCQYRLCRPASRGDVAARAILADLLRWAANPRPVVRRETLVKGDGRAVRAYSWVEEVAR